MYHMIGLKQTRYSESGKKIRGCRGLLGTDTVRSKLFQILPSSDQLGSKSRYPEDAIVEYRSLYGIDLFLSAVQFIQITLYF